LGFVAMVVLLAGCAANPPPSPLPAALLARQLDVAHLPVMGKPDAGIAIIEVTDYQCPFCRAHYQETLPLLTQEFIEPGTVSYFVQDYPLPGQDASGLNAVAAGCAREQGLFWPYHDWLFRYPGLPGEAELVAAGETVGLDTRGFRRCLEKGVAGTYVERQRSLAVGLGVRGTPTFFIGRLGDNQVVTEVTVLAGRQSIADFRRVIAGYQYP
jgi:protein-disulfide isomerase